MRHAFGHRPIFRTIAPSSLQTFNCFVLSTMQVNKFFALGYRNDPAFKEAQSKPCPKDENKNDFPQTKRKTKAAKPAEPEQTDPSARRVRKRAKTPP